MKLNSPPGVSSMISSLFLVSTSQEQLARVLLIFWPSSNHQHQPAWSDFLERYQWNNIIVLEAAPQFGRRKIQGIQSAGAGLFRPADLLLSMISWSVGRRSYACLLISVPIKGGTNLQVVQQAYQHSIAPASCRALCCVLFCSIARQSAAQHSCYYIIRPGIISSNQWFVRLIF